MNEAPPSLMERPALRLFTLAPDGTGDGWTTWQTLLSPEERARADRFFRPRDRLIFTAAHALKRLAIAAAVGEAPNRLDFSTAPGGKPVLAAPAAACAFSLSHTEGFVAVAVSDRPLGVDVENIRRTAVDQALAVTALGRDIAAALGPDPHTDRWREAFFAAWTAREAVLKAEGVGLALPMSQVEIAGDTACLNGRHWRLKQWALPDHRMALAWDGDGAVGHVALDVVTFTNWCETI